MNPTQSATIFRFPRLESGLSERQTRAVWKDIPRLDLSKIGERRWLISQFVAKGSIQIVYGAFGTRKTTAMLLAAWCVSQGQDFLGRKTRQRCVLYVDYENPADVLKSYCMDLGIYPSSPRFAIWDRLKGDPPQPGDHLLEDFIRRCRKQTGHRPWIIFDSWTSLLKSGESGNQIGEAAPIFQAIRHYRDLGATCTIIDHIGKHGKEPIGTSAKMSQADTAHYFSVEEDVQALDGRSSRTVTRVENYLKRYAPKNVGTFSFEVGCVLDEKGDWHLQKLQPTKDKAVVKLEQQIEGLKELITNHPNLGHEELAGLAKREGILTSRNAARRLLQEGTGKHWDSISKAGRKLVYRVIRRNAGT